MSASETRLRIENEILARQEKKYSEEEQANHLMNLLMENYPLLSASVIALDPEGKGVSVFGQRGLSGHFIKEMYARKDQPLIAAAMKGEVEVSGSDARVKDPGFRLDFVMREGFSLFGQDFEGKIEVRNILGRKHEEYQQSGDNRIEINTYDLGTVVSASLSINL